MKRRDFIKTASFLTAAGILIPPGLKQAIASYKPVVSFSLEVITSDPQNAKSMLEKFAGKYLSGDIKSSEYQISGDVMGDLVYMKKDELSDYTKSDDEESRALSLIRSRLLLPSTLRDPSVVRIYKNDGTPAKKFYVYSNGQIVQRINASAEEIVSVYSNKGRVRIKVSGGSAKVTDSDCRHNTCRKMKAISMCGEYIACIPGKIYVLAE